MNKYLKGLAWGGALGMTAAAAAITMMEPRMGRVMKRKGRQVMRQTKRKLNNLM